MFGNLQLYVYYCYFIFVGEFQIMASRQRSAFPPNFVHSLDGSHMMMTALACSKAGLNFAGLVLRFLNFAFCLSIFTYSTSFQESMIHIGHMLVTLIR